MTRKRYVAAWALALLAAGLMGCGNPGDVSPDEPGQASAPPAVTSEADAEAGAPAPAPPDGTTSSPLATATPKQVYSEMIVEDWNGKPMPNMIPIATERPNAFDEPLAQGAPTDEKGWSAFMLPAGKRLFLRAWDPDLLYFANNFYEVPAAEGTRTKQAKITMVPASAVGVIILGQDRRPLPATKIKMLLVHPQHGNWWPQEGITDMKGEVRLGPLPPGEYTVRLKADGIGETETGLVMLPPGKPVVLGSVVLTPAQVDSAPQIVTG
jgi:hypothetical protein